MNPIDAFRKIREACALPNELRLELIGYILDGEDPEYVVEVAQKLSEGYMPLTDLYWRGQKRKKLA